MGDEAKLEMTGSIGNDEVLRHGIDNPIDGTIDSYRYPDTGKRDAVIRDDVARCVEDVVGDDGATSSREGEGRASQEDASGLRCVLAVHERFLVPNDIALSGERKRVRCNEGFGSLPASELGHTAVFVEATDEKRPLFVSPVRRRGESEKLVRGFRNSLPENAFEQVPRS
jgi:hypothetical protein